MRSGLIRKREHLVPLSEATEAGDEIRVPWDKAQVESAPDAEPTDELTQAEEAELYQHYGMTYSRSDSSTGLPRGGPEGGGDDASSADGPRSGEPEPGAAATAAGATGAGADAGATGEAAAGETATGEAAPSEPEQKRAPAAARETAGSDELIRLRKHVVTEHVQTTVPVQREEIRVERGPADDDPAAR